MRRKAELVLVGIGAFLMWYALVRAGVWLWYLVFMTGVVAGIAMSEGINAVDAVVVILAFPVLLAVDFVKRFDKYKYDFEEWQFKRKLGVKNDWDVEFKVQEVLKRDGISVDRAYISPADESGEAEWGWPGIVIDVEYDDAERLKKEHGSEWYKVVEKRVADELGIDVNRVKAFQAEPQYW